jgi:hypothetical protein
MPTPSSTPDQRRDDEARFLLASSGPWLKVRDRATGRPLAYGIEPASRPGLVHLSNGRICTCEDSRRGHDCYHRRAARLHVARIRAEQPRKGAIAAA